MPFCRCGELCLEDKCKKCGFDLKLAKERRNSSADRWQSRYLGTVMGLDTLASPVDEEKNKAHSPCSPLSHHSSSTSSPILKKISRPFSFLDNRKIAPLDIPSSPIMFNTKKHSTAFAVAENSCGECHKKLSGKTVRLPDSQIRYHWACLKCKGCEQPFEETSFFIDPMKRVYHPNCAPSVPIMQKCTRCCQTITGSYLALNTVMLHPRCFRCTGCQKILQPASIYTDLNGAFCQQCTETKVPDDKEVRSKHLKIVPQPQTVNVTSTTTSTRLGISTLLDQMNNLSCFSSPSSVESPFSSSSSSFSMKGGDLYGRPRSPSLSYITTPTAAATLGQSGTVKPSALMSSRGRPLPRFGVTRDCAGCNQKIHSVHEEIQGPKASKWHRKCLACGGCSKKLDSGAAVEEEGAGNLKPWCTTCLLKKKKKTQQNQHHVAAEVSVV